MNDNYYNKKLSGSINNFLRGALKSASRATVQPGPLPDAS